MSLVNFGVGTAIAVRNGVNASNVAITTPTPSRLLIMQDISVKFARDLVELIGQNQMPVDIAAAAMKIDGTAKFAGLEANTANDLFFGQTLTNTASSGLQDAIDEGHTAAASITIAPPGTGTFSADLGVRYAATGIQLTRVGSAPAVGTYEVNNSSGVYTFNASEAGTLNISYRYTVGSAVTYQQITLANQLMGISPTFEINMQMNYPNNGGVVNTLNLKLNACKGSNWGWDFKNKDYTMNDFSFKAFADQAGNLGVFSWVQ